MTVVIDPEFQALIPPLGAEELAQLEVNVVGEGCRDPLVVWAGHNVLLDGHHRFDICQRHGLRYDVREMVLGTREDVADWIDANQLGRRNLPPDSMSLLRGRRYNRTKKAAPNPQGIGGKSGKVVTGQSGPQQTTSSSLAEKHGVSERTIKRDGAFALAVEKLKPTIPDIEQRVMSGNVPSRESVMSAAKTPEKAKSILDTSVHVSHNSGENEWYTPIFLLDAARATLGAIDCDPASSTAANALVQAKVFFTKDTDGLTQTWGKRVWLNPPYAQPLIGQFVEGLAQRVRSGEVSQACVLVNNATETAWGQQLLGLSSSVCFLRGRVKFIDQHGQPSGAPLQGQMVVYIGKRVSEFIKAFLDMGTVLTR